MAAHQGDFYCEDCYSFFDMSIEGLLNLEVTCPECGGENCLDSADAPQEGEAD